MNSRTLTYVLQVCAAFLMWWTLTQIAVAVGQRDLTGILHYSLLFLVNAVVFSVQLWLRRSGRV